jgi:hypothetical protein
MDSSSWNRIRDRLLALAVVAPVLAACTSYSAPAAKTTSASPAPTPTPTPTPSVAAIGNCQNQDSAVADGYVINADPWNTSGRLCINSSGRSDFVVSETNVDPSNVHGGGTLGAYPHIGTRDGGSHGLPAPVTQIQNSMVSWHITQPADGGFNTSLDLWLNPNCTPGASGAIYTDPGSVEIMVWLNQRNITPPSAGGDWGGRLMHFPDVVLGGEPYHVSVETRTGPKYVVYYERVNQVDSVDGLKLADFVQDSTNRRVPSGEAITPQNSNLCAVQAGFEITYGSQGIRTDSFAFTR